MISGDNFNSLLDLATSLEAMEPTLDDNCPRCQSNRRVTKVSAIVAAGWTSGAWQGGVDTRSHSWPTFEWWHVGDHYSTHTKGGIGGFSETATDLAARVTPPPEPQFHPPLFGRKKAKEEFDAYYRIWQKTITLWDRCYYCQLHDLVFINVAGLGF